MTHQRLHNTSSIPLDIQPVSVTADCQTLTVHWKDHVSIYPLSWLESHAYNPPLPSLSLPFKTWDQSLVHNLPTTEYKELLHSDDGLRHWLNNIHQYGLGFVSGVPVNPTDTQALGERISFIRETHYGKFWDFSPNLEHGDTAYTDIALGAHTDSTYFTDPVGLQFFHILQHDGVGGESLYIDGFHVAQQLEKSSKWAYDILCSTELSAQCSGDAGVHITPSYPFKTITRSNGHLVQIRYNNDDRDVLSMKNPKEFYAAHREWANTLAIAQNELWVKLKPGMAVMVDNWRVLHGRAAFTGYRRVVGSYHNRDDVRSRMRKLGVLK